MISEEQFKLAKEYEYQHYTSGIQVQNYLNWEYLEIDPRNTTIGKVIVELGAQNTSLLFGCMGFKRAIIVDPLKLNEIDMLKYNMVGIEYLVKKAEEYNYPLNVDEVWSCNCLTHVQDPDLILDKIIESNAKVLRIAEPLNTPCDDGHLHTFNIEYFINRLGPGKIYSGGRAGYHEKECYQGIINLSQLRKNYEKNYYSFN